MVDPKIIREQPERIKQVCQQKNVSLDVDTILELDTRKRTLTGKLDDVNRLRNDAAKTKDMEAGKRLKGEASAIEAELAEVSAALDPLLLKIPNLSKNI